MGNGIQTELKVPDLWYDFYARILPGSAFIAALRLLIFQNASIPEVREIIILVFAGYFCAILTQPIASQVSKQLEDLLEKKKAPNGDRLYIRKVQTKLGRTSRESMILSKMHGEVVFFIQLTILGIIFLIIQILFGHSNYIFWNIFFIVIFFIESCEVAYRRVKRAIDYEESTL